MSKFGHYLRQAAASVALIATVLGSHAVSAGQILSDSHLMTGTSVISDVGYTFQVSGPGTLSVSLKDLSWPTSSLTDLSFSASTPTNVLERVQWRGHGQLRHHRRQHDLCVCHRRGHQSGDRTGIWRRAVHPENRFHAVCRVASGKPRADAGSPDGIRAGAARDSQTREFPQTHEYPQRFSPEALSRTAHPVSPRCGPFVSEGTATQVFRRN